MRDYGVVSPKWTDHLGQQWVVPQIKGRLKFRIPAHAALRAFVLHRAGGKCEECCSVTELVADHITSRRNGGAHHPDNMQCLCRVCNTRKVSTVDKKGCMA
jgi:5-methylcytosine-specific restriction endonuclease McrA